MTTEWHPFAKAVAEIFSADKWDGIKGTEVTTRRDSDGTYIITVARMYDYVRVSFERLQKLAELVGSTKIDDGDHESYGGCETCDYGSRYAITWIIRDAKPDLPVGEWGDR